MTADDSANNKIQLAMIEFWNTMETLQEKIHLINSVIEERMSTRVAVENHCALTGREPTEQLQHVMQETMFALPEHWTQASAAMQSLREKWNLMVFTGQDSL